MSKTRIEGEVNQSILVTPVGLAYELWPGLSNLLTSAILHTDNKVDKALFEGSGSQDAICLQSHIHSGNTQVSVITVAGRSGGSESNSPRAAEPVWSC